MRDPNLLLRQALVPLLSVVAGIGVLAVLIYWIRVWLRDSDDSAGSTHELLAEYRELNRRGELTDEEYRIIKSRMAPQIRQTAHTTDSGMPKSTRDQALSNDPVQESQRGEPGTAESASESLPPGPADAGEVG